MEKLPEVKYSDQLILTTEQLAAFYGTKTDTLMHNFRRNSSKFEEGVHYFHLKGAALKAFKNQMTNSPLVGKRAASIYLWTKRGAGRHSKMLGTDRAWDMYDALEEGYFDQQPKRKKLTPMQQVQAIAQGTAELDSRVKKLEDTMRVSGSQEREIQTTVAKRVIQLLGGKDSTAYAELSSTVFRQCWHDFKLSFHIPRYSELPRIKFDAGIQYLMVWSPDTATQSQIAKYLLKQGDEQNDIGIG